MTDGCERAPVSLGPPAWQGAIANARHMPPPTASGASGASGAFVIGPLPVWPGSAERRERRAPPTRVTVWARPVGTSLAVRS